MDKVLNKVLSPAPGGVNMTTGIFLALLFLIGFGMGGQAVETGEDIDISAEVTAEINADAEAAVADAEGYQEPAARAVFYGMAVPLMRLVAPIAEGGYAVGYWMAATFGLAVAETVGNALAVSVLGIVAYDVATDIRDVEVSA